MCFCAHTRRINTATAAAGGCQVSNRLTRSGLLPTPTRMFVGRLQLCRTLKAIVPVHTGQEKAEHTEHTPQPSKGFQRQYCCYSAAVTVLLFWCCCSGAAVTPAAASRMS
jgi:hypothetical protein